MKILSKLFTDISSAPSAKFKDNYTPKKVPAKNKKGYKIAYEYSGDWYSWVNSPSEVRKFRIFDLFFGLVALIIFIIASVQQTDVTMANIVAVPSIMSLLPLMLIIFYTVQFCASGAARMNVTVWKDTYIYLRIAAAAYIVLMALSTLACIYRFFIVAPTVKSVFVAFSYLFCAILGGIIYQCQSRLRYKTEPNSAFNSNGKKKKK
jgi:hypothetical protein